MYTFDSTINGKTEIKAESYDKTDIIETVSQYWKNADENVTLSEAIKDIEMLKKGESVCFAKENITVSRTQIGYN